MSIADSLLISVFGFTIVFAVLIALSFLVKLQSALVGMFIGKLTPETLVDASTETSLDSDDSSFSTGELKLINVDEKTAAMIMAIVSDESQIPLHELQFKTIKALE